MFCSTWLRSFYLEFGNATTETRFLLIVIKHQTLVGVAVLPALCLAQSSKSDATGRTMTKFPLPVEWTSSGQVTKLGTDAFQTRSD